MISTEEIINYMIQEANKVVLHSSFNFLYILKYRSQQRNGFLQFRRSPDLQKLLECSRRKIANPPERRHLFPATEYRFPCEGHIK